jgi:ligand-binding sensor domain-containing protein
MYGNVSSPGEEVNWEQKTTPSVIHSEPLTPEAKGSTTEITFDAAGIPYLLFKDTRYPDNPSFIFHRLRFKRSPKNGMRLQWPAFSIIETECTTIEYMRIRFSSGLWVGTPSGLYHLSHSKHATQLGILLNIPSTGPVYDIYQDSRNWLWVAGHEGLFLRAKRRWWRFIDPPGDILFKLNRIAESEVGDIYAARGDQYFWLKWSSHQGRGGVSAKTLSNLAKPIEKTHSSLSL